MSPGARPVLAVVGDGAEVPDRELALARELGRLAIDAGFRVLTGGLGGIMHEASEGARTAPAYRAGDVIAVVPGYDRRAATPAADIVIATGMGHARKRARRRLRRRGGGDRRSRGDAERGLAGLEARPSGDALSESGGWATALPGTAIDDRRPDAVHAAATCAEAIARACELAGLPPVLHPGT